MKKKLAGFGGLLASLLVVTLALLAAFLDEQRSVLVAIAVGSLAVAVLLLGSVTLVSLRHLIHARDSDRRAMRSSLEMAVKESSETRESAEALGAAMMEGLAAIDAGTRALLEAGLDRQRAEIGARLDRLERNLVDRINSSVDPLYSSVDTLHSSVDTLHTNDRRTLEESRRRAMTEFRQYEAFQALSTYLDLDIELAGMRGWAISPDAALELVRATVKRQPDLVLEAGSGISTVIIAATLEKLGGGQLVSLEHEPEFARATRERLSMAGLEHRCRVIDSPLVEHQLGNGETVVWYTTDEVVDTVGVQIVLVDGPPMDSAEDARYPLVPLLARSLDDDCLIFMDDANREPEQRALDRWMAEYPDSAVARLATEKGLAIFTLRRTAIDEE